MRRLTLLLFSTIVMLLAAPFAIAQDAPPAPQFLYRDGWRLVMVNGYTGETEVILDNTSPDSLFEWSPDGKYLVARLPLHESGYCLNLYDVDLRQWVYNEPIICDVWNTLYSPDASQIFYVVNDDSNATLYSFDVSTSRQNPLYQTTHGGVGNTGVSIHDLTWSPTQRSLTFVMVERIMGGSRNYLVVMDIATNDHFMVSANNPFYASYSPVWSADDVWFALVMKDEYVTSGSLPRTNHRGDVYLFNAQSGEAYRLTYTPDTQETKLYWTEDNQLAFTEVTERAFQFSIEQAMDIPITPADQIVQPPPYQDELSSTVTANNLVSPDPNVRAWVSGTAEAYPVYVVNIGQQNNMEAAYSFTLYSYSETSPLIGWRPTDYIYPQG
jgi:hypothetical protein